MVLSFGFRTLEEEVVQPACRTLLFPVWGFGATLDRARPRPSRTNSPMKSSAYSEVCCGMCILHTAQCLIRNSLVLLSTLCSDGCNKGKERPVISSGKHLHTSSCACRTDLAVCSSHLTYLPHGCWIYFGVPGATILGDDFAGRRKLVSQERRPADDALSVNGRGERSRCAYCPNARLTAPTIIAARS